MTLLAWPQLHVAVFVVAAVVVMGLVVVVVVVVCEGVVVEGMVAGTEQAHESTTLYPTKNTNI